MADLELQKFVTRTNEDWRCTVDLPNVGTLTSAVARLQVKPEASSEDDMLDLATDDAHARITLNASAKSLSVAVPRLDMSEFVPGGYVFDVVVDYVAAVTITIASPAVLTSVGNALSDGDSITLATSASLPTGLGAGTPYYVVSNGVDGVDKFRLSATSGGSAINTSGTQSGSHTISHGNIITEANCKLTVVKGVTETPRPEAISVLGDGPILLG